MKPTILKGLLTSALAASLLLVTPVQARIEAPDHVIYGNASLYGNPAAPGEQIVLQLIATGEVIAEYELGRDGRLGDQYALRIPMDTVDPRVDGFARPGDPIQIFVGGELAAETTVGDEGVAIRLDIDPQNLGTGPSLAITDVTVFEGNAGTTPAVFEISLNTTDDSDVVLFWETLDNGATGGSSCNNGVTDYLSDGGQLIIPPGQSAASITIQVCGDTRIEDTEGFILDVVGVQNGVPTRPEAFATIIDDDDVPNLRIADVTVIEPSAGNTNAAVFRPRLSKNSDFEARVAYQTVPLNATPGVDYTPVSGTITIPAGELEAEIAVPVLYAPGSMPPRSFFVTFDSPFNLLIDDDRGLGVILDRAFRPAVQNQQSVVNQQNGVTGLADPTAMALSPDGEHAYAVSEALDTVLVFSRNDFNGELGLSAQYDTGSPGFETALLGGPIDVVVSPDGSTVYVASRTENAVVALARNAATGALNFVENQVDGQMSTPASTQPNAGLGGVRRLLVSADGEHLYAAGADANGVAVFARNATTGELEFLEAELSGVDDPDDSGGVVEAMSRPSGLALSPDGEQLYVASRFGDAIQVFARQTDSGSGDHGRLNYVSALRDGLAGITGLDGAFDIVLSPDGQQLYVTAENDNAVSVFDRAAGGALTLRRVIAQQTPQVPGLGGPQGLAMSADGLEVFVTGFADDSLTIFRRLIEEEDGLAPGDLVVRQTLFDDQGSVLFMAGPTDVEVSGDNGFLYVVANEDNAILVFARISLDVVFFDGFDDP